MDLFLFGCFAFCENAKSAHKEIGLRVVLGAYYLGQRSCKSCQCITWEGENGAGEVEKSISNRTIPSSVTSWLALRRSFVKWFVIPF